MSKRNAAARIVPIDDPIPLFPLATPHRATIDPSSIPSRVGCQSDGGSRPEISDRAIVRAIEAYAMNGRRTAILGKGLCGDPGWNILLDLFVSGVSSRRLSVSAVCIGSGASAATGLRYLTLLCDAKLATRTADDRDGRRSYVTLTELGWRSMCHLLDTR